MRPRVPLAAAAAVAVVAPALVAVGSATASHQGSPTATASVPLARAAAKCDPFTDPVYAGKVPEPNDVAHIELGEKEVRNHQSNRYLKAVDEASKRVRTGVLATSGQGRPVPYAIVGAPKDVKRAERAARLLRDPKTSKREARRIAKRAPAIAWDQANVHGNEESGADAALRLLWDLADRRDCAARQVRDNVVTVIVPIQNPDGRWLNYRRNSYGFDMNRDWFARTQPETDGKLELMRRLPGVLVIDDHEMGTEGFFFPPNSDPVYHEVADRSIRWVNNLYGKQMAKQFDARDIPYFNYDIYDMFYMGYGDSVPMTGFLGAGMTFEKNNGDSLRRRLREQFLAVWTSISSLAQRKDRVLEGWAASYRQAFREGRRGKLEANKVWEAGRELRERVPKQRVRNYYLLPSAAKADETQNIVRRLQRMDVDVRKLTAPLRVRDFHGYGTKGTKPTTLPRGTYWIKMAQAQKHWIQAMLGEDSYTPFPYFYDVTAWSNPLLGNVPGGRSGAKVHPRSVRVSQLPQAPSPGDGPRNPTVGIWYLDPLSTSAYESEGAMRWLYDYKWSLPYRTIKSERIDRRDLAGLDVLVAPGGYAPAAYRLMGHRGRQALRHWIADGGRLVTMVGGTELAARMGLTTARLKSPTSDVPGALIRAKMSGGPLARGVGKSVWSFYYYDWVMHAPKKSVAVKFPAANSRLWSISGFSRGARELANTAAVVDERYRKGRVISFAADPNFRGYTDGTQRIVWNAIYGKTPSDLARTPVVDQKRQEAAKSTEGLRRYANRMVVTLNSTAQGVADQLFAEYGLHPAPTVLSPGVIQYRIRMASAETSPIARGLVNGLAPLGRDVLAVRLP